MVTSIGSRSVKVFVEQPRRVIVCSASLFYIQWEEVSLKLFFAFIRIRCNKFLIVSPWMMIIHFHFPTLQIYMVGSYALLSLCLSVWVGEKTESGEVWWSRKWCLFITYINRYIRNRRDHFRDHQTSPDSVFSPTYISNISCNSIIT